MTTQANRLAKPKPPTDYQSNPFKVTFRGFNQIFKVNQGWAIVILVLGLFSNFSQVFNSSSKSSSSSISTEATIAILVAIVALVIVTVVIGVLYRGAVAYVTLNTIEEKHVGFKEAILAAADKFWTLLWLQIIVSLKILGGFILFIIPGVRALLRYNMVFLPVFDKQANASEAMNDMKYLTKDHLIEVFGMLTAAGIVPFISALLGVGGQIVMYPQLRQLKDSKAPKPKVHWLNYLGFLIILFILFVISSLLLVLVANISSHK